MNESPRRNVITFVILAMQLSLFFVLITGYMPKVPLLSFRDKLETTTRLAPSLHIREEVFAAEEETELEVLNEVEEIVEELEVAEIDTMQVNLPINNILFQYVEVLDGCGPHFEGACLRVRSGPGTDYPVVSRLRNGMVLKVSGKVEDKSGMTWYKIVFDEWLRYPERLIDDWYVSADYVEALLNEGDKDMGTGTYDTNKKIIVDRSEQTLSAYDGDELFMTESISTGLALTPTPRGVFSIFRKTPSRYMQGPLPYLNDKQYYDLPGVPWNLYFTEGGAVIHGAYWHESFGTPYSHGCVNLPPDKAREIYKWAEIGTKVIVQD